MTGCILDLNHVLAQLNTLKPFEPQGVALLRQGCTDLAARRAATIEMISYTNHCLTIQQRLLALPAVPLAVDLPGFGL